MDKLDEDDAPVRVYMVASKAWLEAVHKWRRKQPNPPSLSAAIRELVEIGIKAERGK
jgi:hypothetical protein